MKKNILSLILIVIVCILIVPKELQNDTFYLIKIGESLCKNGISQIDPFSFHNLTYLYPHLILCYLAYFAYSSLSFFGIYLLTIVFTIILGITLFIINNKITKNNLLSLIFTIITIILLKNFITLRGQIVSYTIFILEYYFLDKLNITNNKRYLIYLFILVLILVNVHVAVYPFFWIMYLPYVGEYLYNKVLKKDTKINIKLIGISFILSFAGGMFSYLGINSYTYLFKTLTNSTTIYISEHQPLILIYNGVIILMFIIMFYIINNKKVLLKDKLLLLGLGIMTLSSNRHKSLLIIFELIIINKYLTKYLTFKYKKVICFFEEKLFNKKNFALSIVIILFLFSPYIIYNINTDYINSSLYPIEAVKYIKNNIDYKNKRIYNFIDFGSYLMLNDIKVYIDSRTDLYTYSYNHYRDIYEEHRQLVYGNIYYEDIFEEYNIDYVLLYKTNIVATYLKHDKNYTIEYEDDNFILFIRNII